MLHWLEMVQSWSTEWIWNGPNWSEISLELDCSELSEWVLNGLSLV